MPVKDYLGIDGFCVDVKSSQDVWEALDRLHTQVIDNLDEDSDILRILEVAMEKLMDLEGVDPWH